FYFFDVGVVNSLAGNVDRGRSFEHFIFHEMRSYISYEDKQVDLKFWRSQTHQEVDFVIDERLAIEVKTSQRISDSDLKGLKALSQEIKFERQMVVCFEKQWRKVKDIEIVPYQQFLQELWSGELI
ncbi:MAG: DUF4143 domain-containing protein, partial [Deltaproteobacteria bacterium]|nr:DUF4143 domain-containing protein [Deltaproteobacteria bacterium]